MNYNGSNTHNNKLNYPTIQSRIYIILDNNFLFKQFKGLENKIYCELDTEMIYLKSISEFFKVSLNRKSCNILFFHLDNCNLSKISEILSKLDNEICKILIIENLKLVNDFTLDIANELDHVLTINDISFFKIYTILTSYLEKYCNLLKDRQHLNQIESIKNDCAITLRESEDKYNFLLENVIIGVGIASFSGEILEFNRAMNDLTGYSAEDFNNINICDLYPNPSDRRKFLKQIAIDDKVENMEIEIKQKNGNKIWVNLTSRKIIYQNKDAVLTSLQDISARKQMEAEIQYQNDHLQKEIEIQTKELKSINTTLKQEIKEHQETERKLNLSLKRLREFDGHSTEGIYRIDFSKPVLVNLDEKEIIDLINKHAVIGEVNNSLAGMYGLKPHDMTGKLVSDFAPNYGERALLALKNKDYRVYNLETVDIDKSGNPVYLLENYHAVVKEDKLIEIWGVQKNINDQKIAEKALKESNEFSNNLVETANAIIIVLDENGLITRFNKHAELITGYNKADVIGKSWFDLFIPDNEKQKISHVHRDLYLLDIDNTQKKSDLFVVENNILTKDGDLKLISWNNNIIRNSEKEVVGTLSIGIDITEKRKAEISLRKEHERFVTVMDSLDAVVYVADLDTYEILFVNNQTRSLLGDVTGKTCWKALQENQSGPCKFCTNNKLLNEKDEPAKPIVWEFKNTKTGEWYQCRDQAIKWIDGRLVRLEIATNITPRKVAEQSISKSLREKEILLREVHHRVKNNMQVIISLLRMHSRRTSDKRLKEIFEDSQSRINAMSLVHESLYQSEDLAHIDFSVYLRKLCRNVSHAYGTSGKGVLFNVRDCDVSLDMDQSIAIGMIVSELIGNSYKHAFNETDNGIVSVELARTQDDNITLIVQDNGIGLSDHIDIYNSPSLGLQLVVISVKKELKGNIIVERNHGTKFIISFPAKTTD